MASDVFISYSSKETEIADAIKEVLQENDISCWMAPYSIPAGSNYMEAIPDAIENSKIMIIVLSNNSQKSIWVLKEISQALESNTIMIPFVIENCTEVKAFKFTIGDCKKIIAYNDITDALIKLVTRINVILNKTIDEDIIRKNICMVTQKDDNRNQQIVTHGSIVKDDGSIYTGILINNIPNGEGKMEYANGDLYTGNWENGKRVGKGILKYENGRIYEGIFDNDLPNGYGKIFYTDNDKYFYEGEFVDGQYCGHGILHTYGDILDGEFEKGSMKKGKYVSNDGTIYIGEMRNGRKHGKGKEISSDGLFIYEGDWNNDEREGKGIETYQDVDEDESYKAIYEGDWKGDYREGIGKETEIGDDFKRIYEGNWKNGAKNGKGNETYINMEDKFEITYEGDWVDDVKNGHGKEIFKEYENNKIITVSIYESEWKDGNMYGKVKITHRDGSYYEGDYINDKREGKGKYTYKDGSYYDGEWKDNKKFGEGIYYNSDTKKIEKCIDGKKMQE